MNLSALFLSFALLQTALTPTTSTQFFVVPDAESELRFEETGDETLQAPEFVLCDVNGTELRKITARTETNEATGVTRHTVPLTLSQGYFELQCSATEQSFGIVSLPAFCEKKLESEQNLQEIADPFFAIDGAMSWLVLGKKMDQKRDELVQIARRSGVGMLRERLSWGECQQAAGAENINCEPARHYDSSRKTAMKYGVQVLELCHDAPGWIPKTAQKYPQDFVEMRKSWDVFTLNWNRTWGGMEVWNEPEIAFGANLPADQYAPLLKTIAYQQQNSTAEQQKLKETGRRTPLVSCVMATYNRTWLDTAAECGVLDACDVFSFHTYSHAPDMEKLYGYFQSWLRDSGHPTKPMWLTECGRPWTIGPGRPPQEQDLNSAIDIVMKGVEAKAFGIQRYFPFVYPYYEERTSNFGMMSRDYTPLRSFAAYSQSVRVLAHREYLGDLKLSSASGNEEWIRARVFSEVQTAKRPAGTPDPNAVIVVLYSPEIKPRKVTLPCSILRAERVTGEPIAFNAQTNTLESVDGFVYVWLPASEAKAFLETETLMNQIRKERLEQPKRTTSMTKRSPIVLRYAMDEENTQWTAKGYQFQTTCEEELTLKIAATNLSNETKTIPVQCRALCEGANVTAPETLTIPAGACAEFEVKVIPGVDYVKRGTFCPIEITAEDRIVVNVQTTATLEQLLKSAATTQKLELNDLSHWHHSAAACCDVRKFSQEDGTWALLAHFTEGDHWIYPQFSLPEDVNLSDYDGIILRVRCWDPTNGTTVRFFAFQHDGAFFTNDGICKTDGEWQNVKIPLSQITRCSAAGGTGNGDFQPEKVRKISVGANTKETLLMLEVSDFYLYKE